MKNIDRKDIMILRALDKDARMSYTQIGKYAKISKETVQYRFNRLKSDGIIKNFWTLPKIGNNSSVYKVLIKSKSISGDSFNKVKSFLQSSDVVAWIAITNGYWNLQLTLMASEDSKNLIFLRELFTTYASFFIEIQFLKTIGSYALHEKYLYDNVVSDYVYDSFLAPVSELDELDKKILNLMSNNGRISFTDLSKEVKITPEAILQRFKKLKKSISVIKPRIDHSKLGLSYYHLWLRLSEGKLVKEVISKCINDKYCVFIMEHVGKYQLHLEIVCEDNYIDQYLSNLMYQFEKYILEYDLCKIVSEEKILVSN